MSKGFTCTTCGASYPAGEPVPDVCQRGRRVPSHFDVGDAVTVIKGTASRTGRVTAITPSPGTHVLMIRVDFPDTKYDVVGECLLQAVA